MTWLRALLLALALLVVSAPRESLAAPPTSAQVREAGRLKQEADGLFDQDRYADALALYNKAYGLSRDPALLYNQGRALEAIGDYPEALAKLEQFVELASPELRAKVPGIDAQLADLRSRIATVVVRSAVKGARVLIRDKNVGEVSGVLRVRTRAGKATVEVVAEGHEPYRIDLDLAPGRETRVDAELAPKRNTATLSVRSEPAGATVLVDGVAVGRAPLKTKLDPGAHRVVLRANGYEDEVVDVAMRRGERRDVDVDLRKASTIFGSFWFWAGAAVVVGATAATVIIVTREPEASEGTFDPGRVSAPLVTF